MLRYSRPSIVSFVFTLFKELAIWLAIFIFIFFTAVAINIFPPLAIAMVLPVVIYVIYALPRYKYYPEKTLYKLLLAFVGLSILWPFFIVITVPGFMDLHPSRLILAALVFIWLFFAFKSNGLKEDLFNNKVFFVLILSIIFTKLTGLILGDNRAAIFSASFKEIFEIMIPALVAVTVLKNKAMIEKLFDIIVYVGLVVILVGFWEYFIQTNVLGKYLPSFLISNKEYINNILSGVHRDGYRLQSIFAHPLAFTQFLAMLFPFLCYKVLISSNIPKLIYLLFLTLLIFVMFNTGSRSVLPALAVEMAIIFTLLFVRYLYVKKASFIGWLYIVAFPFFALSFTVIAIAGRHLLMGSSDREYMSYQARVNMWTRGFDSLIDQPLASLLGFGTRMAANYAGKFSNGVLTIDAYPLSVLLESGIPGFLLYIGIYIYASKLAIKTWINSEFSDHFIIALFLSLSGFFVVALISSLTHIIHLFFIFSAMIFVLSRLSNNQVHEEKA